MLPFALKSTTILIIIVVVLVSGIYLLAHDPEPYEDLRSLFYDSEECPSPCFLGINLHTTTREDALEILNGDTRIGDVTIQNTQQQAGIGNMDMRDDRDTSEGFHIALSVRNNLLYHLVIESEYTFGELWRVFGEPESGSVSPIYHYARYPAGLSFRVPTSCQHFWWQPATILISQEDAQTPYDLTTIRQQACQFG